jgi:oxygen-independent coproporphyrinogen-3 oxidase
MELAELARILAATPGRPWHEATIEAAPGGITPEKARGWVEMGINRVSLGAQSFVDAELARTGRRHTAEVVERDCRILRDAGIRNINIDLIAGLPHQTAASWKESLDWVEGLAPEHVSVYMLEVDEDSRLGLEILNGGSRYGAGDRPSDDLTAELYCTASGRLEQMGLARYEISNFGLPSRHNLKYWRREPYAGFGADAHSFDGRTRRQNVETAAEYCARECPCLSEEPAGDDERFFVGLRLTEGIRPSPAEWLRYEAPISRFLEAGLLSAEGDSLKLTARGVLLSNEVFQEFLMQ